MMMRGRRRSGPGGGHGPKVAREVADADTPQAYAIEFDSEVPLEYRGDRVVSVDPGDMRIVPVSLWRAAETPPGAYGVVEALC